MPPYLIFIHPLDKALVKGILKRTLFLKSYSSPLLIFRKKEPSLGGGGGGGGQHSSLKGPTMEQVVKTDNYKCSV